MPLPPLTNSGSPIGPGFVVYEREPGIPGYSLEMALDSVGKGWGNLIRTFFVYMQDRDIVVIQVKEKFGALRIYFTGGTDYDLGFAAGLEAASTYVCETCGEKGELTDDGWLRTECYSCRCIRLGPWKRRT